jgi:hypothetical protein
LRPPGVCARISFAAKAAANSKADYIGGSAGKARRRFEAQGTSKNGATHPTPQIPQMIPVRSRPDSLTFTPSPQSIGIESNFSRCPEISVDGPFAAY